MGALIGLIGRYPPPVVVEPQTPLVNVLRGLKNRAVRHALVQEEGRLVGIISARDILRDIVRAEDRTLSQLNERLARDVMTRDVVTVGFEEGFARLVEKFLEHDFGTIPVVGAKGKAVGVVSERHIVDALSGHVTYVRVGEIASSPLITADAGSTLYDAIAKMVEFNIRRVPFIGETGSLTGIITLKDVVSLLGSWRTVEAIEVGRGGEILDTPLDPTWRCSIASIDSKVDVSEALKKMRSLGVGSLLVRDGDQIVGIVTERDVVRKLPKVMGADVFVDAVRQEIFVGRISKYG